MRKSQNHILVNNAVVSFTDPDGLSGAVNVRLETTSSTGVALFASCKTGEHKFTISAEGFKNEEAAINFECRSEDYRIEKPVLLTEICGCATINLSVKYTQNDTPVTTATVTVDAPDKSIIEEDTEVDMNGLISFESCQIGSHTIEVSNVTSKFTLIDVGCRTENFTLEETVFFTCGCVNIDVNVIKSSQGIQNPATTALVSATDPEGFDLGNVIQVNSDGDVTFQSCKVGKHEIITLFGEFDQKVTSIDVPCNSEDYTIVETISFTCSCADIKVNVFQGQNKIPATTARVTVTDPDGIEIGKNILVNSEGTIELESCKEGNHKISVVAADDLEDDADEDFSEEASIFIGCQPERFTVETDINLICGCADITLTIEGQNSQQASSALVTANTPNGTNLLTLEPVNPDGVIMFESCQDGEHEIAVAVAGNINDVCTLIDEVYTLNVPCNSKDFEQEATYNIDCGCVDITVKVMNNTQNEKPIITAILSLNHTDGRLIEDGIKVNTTTGIAIFQSCVFGILTLTIEAPGYDKETRELNVECEPQEIEAFLETCGCSTIKINVVADQNPPFESALLSVTDPNENYVLQNEPVNDGKGTFEALVNMESLQQL